MKQVRFLHAGTGQLLCLASVADTFVLRFLGLQGRRGLPHGSGLWILPTSGIHTCGMRFPIDAVALDADLRVAGLCPELQPWRIGRFGVTPRSVLELAPGSIRKAGLRTGDTLRVEP